MLKLKNVLLATALFASVFLDILTRLPHDGGSTFASDKVACSACGGTNGVILIPQRAPAAAPDGTVWSG